MTFIPKSAPTALQSFNGGELQNRIHDRPHHLWEMGGLGLASNALFRLDWKVDPAAGCPNASISRAPAAPGKSRHAPHPHCAKEPPLALRLAYGGLGTDGGQLMAEK